MSDESVYRLVLIAGLAGVLPISLYHRLRSQSTRESLDRTQEGLFIMVTLRLLGIATMLGVLAYAIDPRWMHWAHLELPSWIRWLGAGLGVLGGVLLIWTFRTLGPNLTDTVVTRRQHSLVTRGPYRWVRHPFYVAFFLAVVANGLLTANWFIGGSGLLAFALVVLRTDVEERNLVERFGDDYRNYMATTGRFWPRRR